MAVTACTSYYTAVLTGYVPGTGQTVGEIVTWDLPHPVWTTEDEETTVIAIQCQSFTLGGFNGLNN
jgi:hypothetical protein